jgi:hypothetical protein
LGRALTQERKMTTKDESKHDPVVKPVAAPPPPPKAPPPTQEELAKAYVALVEKAEALGQRDDPVVAHARDLLDRQPKKEGKDASSKSTPA